MVPKFPLEQLEYEKMAFSRNIIEIDKVIVKKRDDINKLLVLQKHIGLGPNNIKNLKSDIFELKNLELLLTREKEIYIMIAEGSTREQATIAVNRQEKLNKLMLDE